MTYRLMSLLVTGTVKLPEEATAVAEVVPKLPGIMC